MTAVKVGLIYLTPQLLPSENVVYGVTFVNSAVFVLGWAIGEIWLRTRLGPLHGRRLLTSLGKALVASLTAAGTALLIQQLADTAIPSDRIAGQSAAVAGGRAGIAAALGVLILLKTQELQPILRRLRRRTTPAENNRGPNN